MRLSLTLMLITVLSVVSPAWAGNEILSYEGKTVLITGSTDGLGRELALALAADGAHVIVHGRNAERGAALLDALRAVGEPIFGMDASRISMARLLAYLFEVTERFGMETRTELILLQRTMVVVEGVARGLDPHINIWEVAKPVVEGYITKNVGPRALLRDLRKTAIVLARFGPKLPRMVEAALIAQAEQTPPPAEPKAMRRTLTILVAAGLLGLGVWLGTLI